MARDTCQRENSDLIIIDSKEKNDFVLEWIFFNKGSIFSPDKTKLIDIQLSLTMQIYHYFHYDDVGLNKT